MNRSFRAPESKMQSSALRQRNHQFENFRSSSFRDDELALFHQMKNCEIENDDLLLRDSTEEFVDSPFDLNPKDSHLFNISSSTEAPVRRTGATDDFLNSETDKNDYEWLLTPPGTPLFPSLEMETKKTVMSQLGASTTHPTALKSRLANPPSEHSRRSNLVSKQQPSSPGLTSSAGTRRPLSSGNPGSRPATPTGRSTLSTSSKSSRPSTPTSRTSIASARTMVTTPTSRTSIPSARTVVTTPTSRHSIPSNRTTVAAAKPIVSSTKTTTVPAVKPTPTVPSRSSTPLLRSTTRSSTPTSRPTLSTSRPASRASTPTRRPSTPLNAPSISAPSAKASISKPAPAVSKQPVPSRGTSPARSRPWKPSEMPGFSLDAPPNLRTTLPERPVSATRGRPGAGTPSARSSSIEPASSGRPKRQSCSPSRGQPANGISHTSGSSMPAVNRGYSKVNDKVSPVAMGTKMVERLINMRKLAPPRPDVKSSPHSNLSGKSSSSPDNSGFGRTLSKKSLDMALRHMDIRKSVPGNLRPLMTNIPASSMYSVRSGHQRSLMVSVSGSPHATSSNAGSEVSVNQNGLYSDNSEIDYYDLVSDRGGQSPASVRGRYSYRPSY